MLGVVLGGEETEEAVAKGRIVARPHNERRRRRLVRVAVVRRRRATHPRAVPCLSRKATPGKGGQKRSAIRNAGNDISGGTSAAKPHTNTPPLNNFTSKDLPAMTTLQVSFMDLAKMIDHSLPAPHTDRFRNPRRTGLSSRRNTTSLPRASSPTQSRS